MPSLSPLPAPAARLASTAPPPYRPLGALRLALALMVSAQHCQYLLPLSARSIFSQGGFGAVAVAVFFALSGFVVTEALAGFYPGRPMAFLANRALRLAPPYYAALLVSLLVHSALWQTGRLALWDYTLAGPPFAPRLLAGGVLGLVPGLGAAGLTSGFEFIPFAWSLRVEIAFYLAAALTAWAAARWRPAGVAAWCAGFVCAAGFVCLGRPGILSNLPMFLVGCAWWWREQRDPGRRGTAGLAVVLSLLLAGAGIASWHQRGAPVLAWQWGLALALSALAAAAARCRLAPASARWDRRCGDLAYPLYLNHYAVAVALSSLIAARGMLVYLGGLVAALALAALMARLTDAPLVALRARLRGRELG